MFSIKLRRQGRASSRAMHDRECGLELGDTPFDAQAARAAGISAIGMLSGGFSKDELTAAGCGAVFRNPADLPRHMAESSACGTVRPQ
jgi:phosphoglycolate phosphatase-like HAD superfamily hydrolase